MNQVFFGLKRAFHATLRFGRRALTAMGLTAARFDLLYALYAGSGEMGVMQSRLRRILGVSAPVVSRMLKSLEALGLVVRERAPNDTRQRRVDLTAQGRARIGHAIRRMVRSGYVQLALDSALARGSWFDDDACFWAMCAIDDSLTAVRQGFGDGASLYYRWHPDD
jgi:DNA-binding MarR family transcriptional regulator